MKAMKKLLALLLTGVLLTVAVGCDVGVPETTDDTPTGTSTLENTSNGPSLTDPTPETEEVPEPEPEYPPDPNRFLEKIPEDLNFAAMGLPGTECTVQIAYVEGTNGEYTRRSLQVDALDETMVDKATLERNNRLESKLGLNIAISQVSNRIAGMEEELAADLVAGTCPFDILAGYQYYAMRLARFGVMLDLTDLSELDADFIDLRAPYWGNAYNEAMSYKGSYYWITGDIALRYVGGVYGTYVNNQLYFQHLESDYGSIYDIVRKGNWTLDLLTQMATDSYGDGGAVEGSPDAEDTFGFGYEPNDMMDGLLIGAGLKLTQKDPVTKDVTLALNHKDEAFQSLDAKLKGLLHQKGVSYEYADMEGESVMTAFSRGTLVFTIGELYQAGKYLPNMDDYAVLPMPKADANQKYYRTTVHDGCTVFGITTSTERVAQSAAALEFLCAYSYELVRPVFYDELFDNSYSKNADRAEMLSLLHESITTDFALAWGQDMDNLIHPFRDYNDGVKNTIARNRDDWAEMVKEFAESLGRLY